MAIKITIERTLSKDGEREVSLMIDGMKSLEDLPKEYVSGAPMVHIDHSYTFLPVYFREVEGGKREDIALQSNHKPSKLSPEVAERLIKVIQAAGDRLHLINQSIEREKALYEGKSELII